MDERMRAEHGHDVHVLLRMMKLVEAPEHTRPMVRQMDGPIAGIHGHEDRCDRQTTGDQAHPREDNPGKDLSNDLLK